MANRQTALDATPFFPEEGHADPAGQGPDQSAYRLEVSGPGYSGPSSYDLPQTGLKGRALEVGRAPDKGLAIDLEGLGRVHFFLLISNGIVQVRSFKPFPLTVKGRPVPADDWLNLEAGAVLDCGSNISLRLLSNQVAAEFTPLFDGPVEPPGRAAPPASVVKARPAASIPAASLVTSATPPLPVEDDEDDDWTPPARKARTVERRFRLTVKDSRYNVTGEAFFSLRDGEIVEIGRNPQARLVVDDPKVSQRHAYLLVKGKEILLFDGDPDTRKPSHNGTWFFINGRLTKISGSQGLKINAGANFRVGYTNLLLEAYTE